MIKNPTVASPHSKNHVARNVSPAADNAGIGGMHAATVITEHVRLFIFVAFRPLLSRNLDPSCPVVNGKNVIDGTNALFYGAPMAKPMRLDIYPSEALLRRLELWRSRQKVIPTRAEAIRMLVERSLALDGISDDKGNAEND